MSTLIAVFAGIAGGIILLRAIAICCRKPEAEIHVQGMVMMANSQAATVALHSQHFTPTAPAPYPAPNTCQPTNPTVSYNYNPYYPAEGDKQIINPHLSLPPPYTEHPSENHQPAPTTY